VSPYLGQDKLLKPMPSGSRAEDPDETEKLMVDSKKTENTNLFT